MHIDDFGPRLQLLKDLVRHLLQLAVRDGLAEVGFYLLLLLGSEFTRGNVPLASKDEILAGGGDDGGDVAGLHGEYNLLDLRVSHVFANRRDESTGGSTIGVLRVIFGQDIEGFRTPAASARSCSARCGDSAAIIRTCTMAPNSDSYA